MTLPRTHSEALFERAHQVLPLGVTSNFRYWGDDKTLYAERGEGAYIWDVDGNRYVDHRLGVGPVTSVTAIRTWWRPGGGCWRTARWSR